MDPIIGADGLSQKFMLHFKNVSVITSSIHFRNFRKGLIIEDVGTGKFHVILAIGNLLLEQNSPYPIVYIAEYPHNVRIENHFKGIEVIEL